ncbi:hypothetical protein [Actinomadura rubrisoli]|nr:hypothetical protein [Actinomadura rubrisoli]
MSDGILRRRSFQWLMVRVEGLFWADTRLSRRFRPPDKDEQKPAPYE